VDVCLPEATRSWTADATLRIISIDMLKVEIEKLDCVLSKRATRLCIYGNTSANAYVLIYV